MKEKITFPLILLFVLCLIMGCGDDEKQSDASDAIVGHWRTTTVSSTRVNTFTGAVVEYDNEHITIDVKMYQDGTCNMNNTLGTYKVLGKELDIYLPNPDKLNTVELVHYTIEEISATRMVLTSNESASIREKGVLTHWDITYKYHFEKVGQIYEGK